MLSFSAGAKMMKKLFLSMLICLVALVYSQTSESPCDKYFKYKKVSEMWVGLVTVPAQLKALPLKIHVHLSLKAMLKTKYAGLIELAEPPDKIIGRMLNQKNETLVDVNYVVRFPLPSPLPEVQFIYLNETPICTGGRTFGPVVTHLHLSHEFPTNQEFLKELATEKLCGVSLAELPKPLGTLPGNGEWPWLAAILSVTNRSLEFHCSGTLITLRHILTAAHCALHEDGTLLDPGDLVVYFGKHHLGKWKEINSQLRQVKEISAHPDFSTAFYTADIAIMSLSSPVLYSEFVRPVCLWRGDQSLRHLVGKLGVVAGWGRNKPEGPIRTEPRIVQIPVVDQEECLRSRKDYLYITSDRTLCAGFKNGSGLCNGDSGGGLIFYTRDSKGSLFWQIRGVISLSLLDQTLQLCDVTQFVVFTDAAKFLPWILNITGEDTVR